MMHHSAHAETIKSHAITLSEKPKYEANFERFEYTSPKAKKGGKIKIAEIGTFDTTNPFTEKGVSIRNYGLIYDSLMQSSADEPSTFYGLIAESIEYDSKFDWIIFNLNPNATFSDGKPILSEDVRFTFDILRSKGTANYKLYFSDITQIEVLTKHRIKFSLKRKNKDLILGIASIRILPKHYWTNREFEKTTLDLPVSSGPYRLNKLDAGRFVEYQRNDTYWARDLNVNKGLYNFDTIQVDYYRDTDIAFEAFKAGAYDYHYELISKSWATGYDVAAVKNGDIVKLLLPDNAAKGISGVVFNQRKPVLQDLALRKAMNLAFDFEWTNKNLFYGLYKRTQSAFQDTEYQAQSTPSKAELDLLTPFKDILPKEVFGEAYLAPITDGKGNNRANLRKAKKLLQEAGYSIKEGQLISPITQKPVKLEYLERQKGLEKIVNPWIANLKRLGITVEFRMMDQTQWINRLQSYDFDLIGLVYRGIEIPGNEQELYWGSESAKTPMSSNYPGVQNKAIDHLTQKVINAKNKQERITAARALDRILTHSQYVLPKYHNPNNKIAYWNKFSRPEKSTRYDFRHELGLHTWWYNDKKANTLNKKAKK